MAVEEKTRQELQNIPALYMIVGLPCSGKSTIVRQKLLNVPGIFVLSTDDFIEAFALSHGITYTEAFANHYGSATTQLMVQLRKAIEANASVVWDQTNLTAKQRKKKLGLLPSHYAKYAIVTEDRDPDVLFDRMQTIRPDKVVPLNVMKKMASDFEMPTKEEGFNAIFLSSGDKIA